MIFNTVNPILLCLIAAAGLFAVTWIDWRSSLDVKLRLIGAGLMFLSIAIILALFFILPVQ